MPLDPAELLSRVQSLFAVLVDTREGLQTYGANFERNLNYSLRRSQLNELQELYSRVLTSIRAEEQVAAITASEVWISWMPAFSSPELKFQPLIIPSGKTPWLTYNLSSGEVALGANDFRREVEALFGELKDTTSHHDVYTSAADLIGTRMAEFTLRART